MFLKTKTWENWERQMVENWMGSTSTRATCWLGQRLTRPSPDLPGSPSEVAEAGRAGHGTKLPGHQWAQCQVSNYWEETTYTELTLCGIYTGGSFWSPWVGSIRNPWSKTINSHHSVSFERQGLEETLFLSMLIVPWFLEGAHQCPPNNRNSPPWVKSPGSQ